MIRAATQSDVPALVPLARDFMASHAYWGAPRGFDDGTFAAHAGAVIAHPDCGVFVSERGGGIDGVMALLVARDPFDGGVSALKMHWLGAHGSGLRLERHGREWAAKRGATGITMSAVDDRGAALLERLGYRRAEIIYRRGL